MLLITALNLPACVRGMASTASTSTCMAVVSRAWTRATISRGPHRTPEPELPGFAANPRLLDHLRLANAGHLSEDAVEPDRAPTIGRLDHVLETPDDLAEHRHRERGPRRPRGSSAQHPEPVPDEQLATVHEAGDRCRLRRRSFQGAIEQSARRSSTMPASGDTRSVPSASWLREQRILDRAILLEHAASERGLDAPPRVGHQLLARRDDRAQVGAVAASPGRARTSRANPMRACRPGGPYNPVLDERRRIRRRRSSATDGMPRSTPDARRD